MTRHRLRALVPVVALALVAVAAACESVKKTPVATGPCTQYWRGYVLASDHNYAGLGAYNGSDRYMCKETPTQGVRAQIQHLRNYADANAEPTQASLGNPFEPRVKYDAAAFMSFPFKGDAPRWIDLEGKWAVPGDTYADNIINIYNQMRAYNDLPTVTMSTQKVMQPSALTAAQMAKFVEAKNKQFGNTWRPEITPTQMAQLYLAEGAAAKVAGDIAFCQSILETGWFAWPGSYGEQSVDTMTTEGFDPGAVTARN